MAVYNKLLKNRAGDTIIPVTQDVYSTSETVVGAWTSGETIYRKVITGFSLTPVVGANSSSIDLSNIGISKMIKIEVRVNKGESIQFVNTFYLGSNNYLAVFFQPWNGTLQIRYGADATTQITGEFIIEYTKTTD